MEERTELKRAQTEPFLFLFFCIKMLILYQKYRMIRIEGGEQMAANRQMVRVTSLAKHLNTVESSIRTLVKTEHMYQTEEERKAFLAGMEATLKIIRREYGITDE